MSDDAVMMIVGGGLVVLGGVMIAAHRRTWRREREDATHDSFEQTYLRRRFRRRVQTSLLLVVLGLLVALHPVVIPNPKDVPRLFAGWWIAALAVAGWVILMAIADIVSTRAHSHVSLARLNVRQRQLRQQLEHYQRDQADHGSREGERPEENS